MSNLMLHTGGKQVDLDDLKNISLPKETKSYKPVNHYDLVTNLNRVATDLLPDYTLTRNTLGVAKKGNQLFGISTYKNGSDELGLSIGFRNSYDKSMSVGIAIGANVFVCDNLALMGEIAVMRKHTLNVWADLEETIVTTIYRSQSNFTNIMEDAEKMRMQNLDDNGAYQLMGILYGKGILQPRMLPVTKKAWLKPAYSDFAARNKWSFYNACTEALKKAPPPVIMEKHIQLHEILAD